MLTRETHTSRLSPEEIARRREADRRAKDCNRLEGMNDDPIFEPIFEAWILGEIEIEEALERIKSLIASLQGNATAQS